MSKVVYWVDDLREPKKFLPESYKRDMVVWLKNYEEFENKIKTFPLPDEIWFDHDLGKGKSGKDCADFLVDWCLEYGEQLPEYHSQSQNPVGKENIIKLLDSYNKFYKEHVLGNEQ